MGRCQEGCPNRATDGERPWSSHVIRALPRCPSVRPKAQSHLTLMSSSLPDSACRAADVVCSRQCAERDNVAGCMSPGVHLHMAHAVMVNRRPIVSSSAKRRGQQTRGRRRKAGGWSGRGTMAGMALVVGLGTDRHGGANTNKGSSRARRRLSPSSPPFGSFTPLPSCTQESVPLHSPPSSMRDVARTTPPVLSATARSWSTGAPWTPAQR